MPKLLAIKGVPLIGLYIRATEDFAILGIDDEKAKEYLREELGVDVVVTTVMGSELVGALACANSNGVLVNSQISSKELEAIKKVADVKTVESNITCLGNVVCVNDKGAILHPEVDEAVEKAVSDFLNVDVARGTIGGVKTVGMSAVVTNRGGLLNPNSSEWEIKIPQSIPTRIPSCPFQLCNPSNLQLNQSQQAQLQSSLCQFLPLPS